jgi:superfamily II DNA/RNA helicase
MLDMGFEVQINKIIKFLPVSKQVLMFSATIPNNILKLSSKYLNDPVRISVGESNTVAKNIKQETIELKSDEKLDELINQINTRSGSILIFVKTKYGTEKLSKALSRSKIKSFPLHGGLRQSKRNTIMKNFRDMKFRILIATDVAARGIDVPHIEHVINYDLPQMAEDFIHRIGRTARAGSKGVALSFVTKGDFSKWKEIQKILNPEKHIKSQHKSKNKSSKKSISRKREDNKRPTFKKKPDYKKSFSKKSGDQDEKNYSKDKRSRKSYSEKREDNKRPTFKKKPDYKKSFSKKSSDQSEKNYTKNKFKKNNRQDDFNSNTKVSFSRKKTNNRSSDKKKSPNRGQKNSSKGNSQSFNSPRKRRK